MDAIVQARFEFSVETREELLLRQGAAAHERQSQGAPAREEHRRRRAVSVIFVGREEGAPRVRHSQAKVARRLWSRAGPVGRTYDRVLSALQGKRRQL